MEKSELHRLIEKLDEATRDGWMLLRHVKDGEPRQWSVRLNEGFSGISGRKNTAEEAVRAALQYLIESAQRTMKACEEQSRLSRDELAKLQRLMDR